MNKKALLILTSVALGGSQGIVANPKKAPAKGAPRTAQKRDDMKIGTVDLLALMRESKEGEQAGKRLEEKRMKMTQDIQKEEQKIQQEITAYKSKQATLSDSAREKAEKELVKLRRDYENKVREYEEQLKMEMQQATERVAKKADETIERVAREKGLDLVQCVSTGKTWDITHKTDITKDVKTVLDKDYTVAQNKAKNTQVAAKRSKPTQAKA